MASSIKTPRDHRWPLTSRARGWITFATHVAPQPQTYFVLTCWLPDGEERNQGNPAAAPQVIQHHSEASMVVLSAGRCVTEEKSKNTCKAAADASRKDVKALYNVMQSVEVFFSVLFVQTSHIERATIVLPPLSCAGPHTR